MMDWYWYSKLRSKLWIGSERSSRYGVIFNSCEGLQMRCVRRGSKIYRLWIWPWSGVEGPIISNRLRFCGFSEEARGDGERGGGLLLTESEMSRCLDLRSRWWWGWGDNEDNGISPTMKDATFANFRCNPSSHNNQLCPPTVHKVSVQKWLFLGFDKSQLVEQAFYTTLSP